MHKMPDETCIPPQASSHSFLLRFPPDRRLARLFRDIASCCCFHQQLCRGQSSPDMRQCNLHMPRTHKGSCVGGLSLQNCVGRNIQAHLYLIFILDVCSSLNAGKCQPFSGGHAAYWSGWNAMMTSPPTAGPIHQPLMAGKSSSFQK